MTETPRATRRARARAAVGRLAVDVTPLRRSPVWIVYVGVALLSATSAIDGPARNAMTPRLVGRDLVPAAAALNQIVWQVTALVGPALAGLVIAGLGLSWAYGVDLVTYGAMLFAALAIRPVPPERSADAKT